MRACLWVAAILIAWLTTDAHAYACKCMPPDEGRSYENADHVLHVSVQRLVSQTSSTRTYLARVLEDDFKGCLQAGQRVMVETATSSATCGMSLTRGEEYLLHGQRNGSLLGAPRIHVASCDANTTWDALTSAQQAFLDTRYVCCGKTCACGDGSAPVNCLVDPCQFASCDVAEAECRSNYCGGCNAEWVDPSGALVCTSANTCDYEDPTRRYVARSPNACQAVRFVCAAGEQAFFDDCGCGCEPAPVEAACKRSGCSGELCVAPGDERTTICLYRPEYACLDLAICERQLSGACGFTQTQAYEECLEGTRGADAPR